jgi:hypothetical protein
VIGFAAEPAMAEDAAGMGGFGGGVHYSAFAEE